MHEGILMRLNAAQVAFRKYGQDKEATLCKDAANAIKSLKEELVLCRNELCLRCGDYTIAHKGACDGCRWRDVE